MKKKKKKFRKNEQSKSKIFGFGKSEEYVRVKYSNSGQFSFATRFFLYVQMYLGEQKQHMNLHLLNRLNEPKLDKFFPPFLFHVLISSD